MTVRTLTCGALAILILGFVGPAFGGGGMVALVTCEPSCPDDSTDFFVDCGNGTVTDNRTGLVWLANANCFGWLGWREAMAVVAGLGDLDCGEMDPDDCDCGLSDHSSPGEWRLPSLSEWLTLVAMVSDVDVCEVAITNDAGNGCWEEGCFEASTCSFYDVQPSFYWSASSYVPDAGSAWVMDLAHGLPDAVDKQDYGEVYLWPVRGGQ